MDLIESRNSPNASYSSLLVFFFFKFYLSANCKSLLSRIPLTKVKHVYWEAKKCVDALARKGCTLWEDFVIFDVPHSSIISSFVCLNVNGLTIAYLAILAS